MLFFFRMNPRCSLAGLIFCLFCLSAIAQQPAPSGLQGYQDLERWREQQIPAWMNDFGNLERYREADASLKPPGPDEQRIVFMGDSITDGWNLAKYFPGKPYVNRGISGQTTPQMLIRFREDVISLQPKVVVILAGINDLAGNTGPMSLEETEANYASMADLARAHGIAVVLSSVTPTHNYTEKAAIIFPKHPHEKILALNAWLKDYAAKNGDVYLDYFDAMVDDRGMLQRDLALDGLHPNAAGYAIMAPLAQKAIEKALSSSAQSSKAAAQ
jgi:lysophospholipase L1-like esterase